MEAEYEEEKEMARRGKRRGEERRGREGWKWTKLGRESFCQETCTLVAP
jgi:hypothetical protein